MYGQVLGNRCLFFLCTRVEEEGISKNCLYSCNKSDNIDMRFQGHNGVPPDAVPAAPGKDGKSSTTQYRQVCDTHTIIIL